MKHLILAYYIFSLYIGIHTIIYVINKTREKFDRNLAMLIFLLVSGNIELCFKIFLDYRALNIVYFYEQIDFIIYMIRGPVSLTFFVVIPILLHSLFNLERVKALNLSIIIISAVSLFMIYLFSDLSFDELTIIRKVNSFPSLLMMSVEVILFVYSILILFFKRKDIKDPLLNKLLLQWGIVSIIYFPFLLSDMMLALDVRLNYPVSGSVVFHPLYFSIWSILVLRYFNNMKRRAGTFFEKGLSDHFSEEFLDANYFTQREKDVIRHILEGHGNKQIAEALALSTKTVNNQIYNLYKKLNINSRHELFNLFYKNAEAHRSFLRQNRDDN